MQHSLKHTQHNTTSNYKTTLKREEENLHTSDHQQVNETIIFNQTSRRCGSLAADSRHLESNTNLIGEISSDEVFKMADVIRSAFAVPEDH